MGGGCRRQPPCPPPPGRRGRVPVGCSGDPPRRAPHVYGNPPPGAPPPGVGRPHRRPPRPRAPPRRHVAGCPAEDARQGLPAPSPRPPARAPGPPLPTVGRPLAPPSRPLVPVLQPPPHTCNLCRECDTVSSPAPAGANRCARCSQVAACPCPEPLAGPRRRTEEEALHQRIGSTHATSHGPAGRAGAALLWIHVHLRDPTSVAYLSHVFAS